MRQERLRSIRKAWSATDRRGFSSVEALLAAAVFGLFVTAFMGAYLYGEEASALAGNRSRATLLAEEGLEAMRNIRDAGYSNLVAGSHGIAVSGGQWAFSGSQDTSGIFTRQIDIALDGTDRKTVTSTVTWQQNPQRAGSVSLTTLFSDWVEAAPAPASCNDYAVQQGYASGVCRQNATQCTINGETHVAGGDSYCIDGSPEDTCCVLP